MRRSLLLLAVVTLATGASGCGHDQAERLALQTPPDRPQATPLPEIERATRAAERAASFHATRRDAVRARPLLRGWGAALAADDSRRAAHYFALPAIVAQGQVATIETQAQARDFNDAIPCGARLLGVRGIGRFLVGTFVLTPRPEHRCVSRGRRIRIAFVLHAGKFTEWRRVPRGASEPGPSRPENAPEPPRPKVA
jgi:hypothetical protein